MDCPLSLRRLIESQGFVPSWLAFWIPAEAGFELGRRFVAQRRMKAPGVVGGFEESADLVLGVFEV
jgi:hypothetical protein